MKLMEDCKDCPINKSCSVIKILQITSMIFDLAGENLYVEEFGIDHSAARRATEADPRLGFHLVLNNPSQERAWLRISSAVDKLGDTLELLLTLTKKEKGGQHGEIEETDERSDKETECRNPSLN